MGKKVCYLVAPYSPVGGELVNLGAARKIEAIVRILVRVGFQVRLINTAHNDCSFRGTQITRRFVDGYQIVEIIPFTVWSRPVGKLLNLTIARWLGRRTSRPSKVALVWLYNAYAFEALYASGCRRDLDVTLEIEDLPSARSRGLINAKNRLESLLFPFAVRRATLITCVNLAISRRLTRTRAKVLLLPGLISSTWFNGAVHQPFGSSDRTVGYFGGLTEEKGAAIVLSILPMLPKGWRMVVTGNGPYAAAFARATKNHEQLVFVQNSDASTMRDLMFSCDVLLNPHATISDMSDGVFPFKVYEFLSTGRLVLSTPLPETEIDCSRCIVFCARSAEAFLAQIVVAEALYYGRREEISRVAELVKRDFAEDSLASKFEALLSRRTG